jgi:hypothetical protein
VRPTVNRTAAVAVTTGRAAGRRGEERTSGLPWRLCNAVGGARRGNEQGNHPNVRNMFSDMR